MKKFFIILIVLLLIGWMGWRFWGDVQRSQLADNVASSEYLDTVMLRDIEMVVKAEGETIPLVNTEVRSEVGGRVEEVFIEDGQSVKKGQPLLQLERSQFENALVEAKRSLESFQLRLEKADRNYRRLEDLFAKNFVQESDFLDAETEWKLAKLDLEIREARLRQAEEDLSKTMIVAPNDGVVLNFSVSEGQVISGASSVSNGTKLLDISDLKKLYVATKLNEIDIAQVRLQQAVRLRFNSLKDKEFPARIAVIALSAVKESNRRLFPVEVVFDVQDEGILPGISADVIIPVDAVSQVPSVMISAVFTKPNEQFVYLRAGDGSFIKQPVVTGLSNFQFVQIVEGLQAGDEVSLRKPAQF